VNDTRRTAYISGALSNVEDLSSLKGFYERIGELCEASGIGAYVPHLMGTDPVENPDVTPKTVYARDMERVDAADLVIAYVGERSLGVGAEIERTQHTGADVILLYEGERYVSRLTRGTPSVWATLQFVSFDEAIPRLRVLLERWKRERGG